MRHFLINPTWRCQNACSYCWVQQTVRVRPELMNAPERSMDDWVNAIRRDGVELVDVAGGEPFLLPWMPYLFPACPDTKFGLSTNGLALGGLRRMANMRPHNVTAINISYHPESHVDDYEMLWRQAIMAIRATGGKTHSNIVDVGDNVEASETAIEWMKALAILYEVSPYEDMSVLDEMQETPMCCKGGEQHLVVAPDGTAWPCLSWLRSPFWRDGILGNWLDGTVDLSRKPNPCHLYCIDYHVLKEHHVAGDMWLTEAHPCEEEA